MSCTDRQQPIDRGKRGFKIQFQSVARQVRHGNHQQTVLFAEPDEIGHARHCPIIIDDLADHARGIHGRETGKINGRLCLPAPFKDAARTRAQWKNVSRPPEIFRKSE